MTGGINITRKHVLSIIILSISLTCILFPNKSIATKWVYPFVVWDGFVYVVSEEYVTEIDSKIGHVTMYSNMEERPGNFSNIYKKGTKYYSIKGVSTEESIAIREFDGKYKKADRKEEYRYNSYEDLHEEEKFGFSDLVKGLSVLLLIIVFGTFFVRKNRNN